MIAGEPLDVVRAFEDAYNDHDAKTINSLYAPDAEFQVEDIMAIEGKPALQGKTDYDIELHTHIHINPVSVKENRLRARVMASSEWLLETGIGTAQYEAEFEVADGMIKSIIARPVPQTKAAIGRVLNDFIEWAMTERPCEAGILMPDGRIVFNAHNARLGLIMLKEWKAKRD